MFWDNKLSILQYTHRCNCRPLHAVGYGTSRHYIDKNTDLDVTMIRKQTSQDICLGEKRATSVYLKAQVLNAPSVGFFDYNN